MIFGPGDDVRANCARVMAEQPLSGKTGPASAVDSVTGVFSVLFDPPSTYLGAPIDLSGSGTATDDADTAVWLQEITQ